MEANVIGGENEIICEKGVQRRAFVGRGLGRVCRNVGLGSISSPFSRSFAS